MFFSVHFSGLGWSETVCFLLLRFIHSFPSFGRLLGWRSCREGMVYMYRQGVHVW